MKYLRLLSILIMILPLGFTEAAEQLSVSNAWARASAPGQEVGAVYMTLTSASELTLTSIASPAAENAEIHRMSMNDGIMRMRMIEMLALAPGEPVKLQPGGLHLMLFGLKQPLKAGDSITVTLNLKDKHGQPSSQTIAVPVKAATN